MRGVTDPSVSAFSLSLYRHPFIYTLFSSRFTLIINHRFSSNTLSALLNATAERAKLLLMETKADPPFFCTLRELLEVRLEQDIRLNSKMKRETRPCLQQMANHIRSNSKVTGEGTSQPNGPDIVSLLATVPHEDRYRTWAACRTIMLSRTTKRVKEQVDKMRPPAVVRLCELWRHGKNRSPPGGRRPRTTFHLTPSPSEWTNTMENLQIVMNQLPAMLRRCRIITLKLHGLLDNGLGNKGTERFAEVLAQCTALTRLMLSRHQTVDGGT
jgi:hypothetical protein